jgi:hypothetical protein
MRMSLLGAGMILLCGATPLPAQQIGELALHGGIASGLSGGMPASVMIAGSFSFVKSRFSFGPEVMYAAGGNRHVIAWGGVARFKLVNGALRPYLVGGLGSYNWEAENRVNTGLFSGSVGAGVLIGHSATRQMQIEARWHDNLQNIDNPGPWRLLSITAGLRLGW